MRTFDMASLLRSCSTRERGRKVYPALDRFVRDGGTQGTAVSFEGVRLVTASFLDETIGRLLREEIVDSVVLVAVGEFPTQSLLRILNSTGNRYELQPAGDRAYRLAPLAA